MWSDMDLTPSVCPLIHHGQQPMKMHTEVTLLYKYRLNTENGGFTPDKSLGIYLA